MLQLCQLDNHRFGPTSLCRGFDFTFRFQHIVLSIIPCAIFIVTAAIRLRHLLAKSQRLPISNVRKCECLLAFALPVLAIIRLATSQHALLFPVLDRITWLPALVLDLVASLFLSVVQGLEAQRTLAGHFLVPCFLLASLLFQIVDVRSLYLAHVDKVSPVYVGASCALVAVRALLLVAIELHFAEDNTPNRRLRAPFFNRLVFFWHFANLLKSVRKPWSLQYLRQVDPTLSSHPDARILQKNWNKTKHKAGTKARLFFALLRSFPLLLLKPAIYKVVLVAATLAQPFLISDTLHFLQAETPASGSQVNSTNFSFKEPLANGWGLVAAFALVYTTIAFSSGQYYFSLSQASFVIRGSLMHSVLHHTRAIHLDAASRLGPSAATNLVAADVERVIESLDPFHEIWTGLVVIGIGSYIVYLRAGLCFLGPLIVAFLFLGALPQIGSAVGAAQGEWAAATDQRVALTSSIFRGIQTVKSCSWDRLAASLLIRARQAEVDKTRVFARKLTRMNFVTNILEQSLGLAAVLPLAIVSHFRPNSGYTFTLNSVFTVLAAVSILQQPLFSLGHQLSFMFVSGASLGRVQDFLESQPRQDARCFSAPLANDAHIALTDVTLSRGSESPKDVLQNAFLSFPKGSISVITGPPASGKSTLLLAILGELTPQSGEIQMSQSRPKVTYASQKAWIMESTSLRENILCGRPYEEEWYQAVLDACSISNDPAFNLEAASMTDLSGGQRQRINLARCFYGMPQSDAMVIDDPFSALDAATENHITQGLISLQRQTGKTIICVTESGDLIDNASYLAHLEAGKVSYQGPVLDTTPRRYKSVSSSEPMPEIQKARKTASPPTAVDVAKNEAAQAAEGDDSRAKFSTMWFWVQAAGNWPVFGFMLCSVLSVATQVGSQIYLQRWSSGLLAWPFAALASVYTIFIIIVTGCLIAQLVVLFTATLRASQKIHDDEVRSILAIPLHRFTPAFLASITTRLSQDLFLIDLQWPSDLANFSINFLTVVASMFLMIIPAPFLIVALVPNIALAVILVWIYTPSSRNLRHMDLSSKDPLLALYTELQDGVDTIRALESELPAGVQEDAQSGMNLQHLSPNTQSLDRDHSSPAITRGLELIDLAQLPYFYLESCRCWLLTWLGLIAALVNTSLVIILVATRDKLGVSSILGVSLLQTVSLSANINSAMIAWTEAQISSVALDRARRMTALTPELDYDASSAIVVGDARPQLRSSEAQIEFKSYSARYFPKDEEEQESGHEARHADLKLRRINLRISKGEHVVVCGPSGCGKSTLLGALSGTIDQISGTLLLDGQNTRHMSLHDRRSKFVLVPQAGFQLIGKSVRDNLVIGTDLTGEAAETDITDQELHDVLSAAKLGEAVSALELGLDTVLETGTLSPGQWALLNLARCILIARRRECIILLDEINASLDRQTDELVQQVIKNELKGQTVIAVMHKVDVGHAGDWSKTVKMENGEIVGIITRLQDKADG